MIVIVVDKDSSPQISWRMHQSRNPFGEEGRIHTVDVSNPKAAIAKRPASKLQIHLGNTPGTPQSGVTLEELLHACSEPIADGSRGPEDGHEVGGMAERIALIKTRRPLCESMRDFHPSKRRSTF